LNHKIFPFPWDDEEKRLHILSGDHAKVEPILYTGPPPTLVAHHPPNIPPASSLVANIINSLDKLFFVSHSLGNPSARQWQLVRVAFADSTLLLPSCLQDSHFLVEFYTLHYSDVRYNATHQRYWLQYHTFSDITTLTSSTLTHLIHPSDMSDAYAAQCKLVPFHRWLNLTHSDTYIHGPFDFVAVNGRKTRDRISQSDWDVLATHSSMFHIPIPQFNLSSYSIHVDRGVHSAYCIASNNIALHFIADLGDDSLIP
jgi:hypothetical protein